MLSPALHTFPIKDPPTKHKNTLRLTNCPLPHTPSLKRPPVLKGIPLPIPTLPGQLPAAGLSPRETPLPPGSPPRPAHPPLSATLTSSTATPPRERFNCRSSSPAPGSGFLPYDWLWLLPSQVFISKIDARHSVPPQRRTRPPKLAIGQLGGEIF